jgi:preprotein translocase subunit YajC
MSFFIASAYAQAATTTAPVAASGSPTDSFMQMLPPLAMAFAVMYFLIIRPQQKQQKQQKELINTLKNGEEIITASGIHGKVIDASQDVLSLQIAPNTVIQIDRSQVQVIKSQQVAKK